MRFLSILLTTISWGMWGAGDIQLDRFQECLVFLFNFFVVDQKLHRVAIALAAGFLKPDIDGSHSLRVPALRDVKRVVVALSQFLERLKLGGVGRDQAAFHT